MNIPPWMDDLQPASWRGFKFFVDGIKVNTGRRVAVHEYPFRNKPWVEDLGMGLQEISFQAFILGDDVASQYLSLKAECEKAGSGELVHPRIGSLNVSLVSCAFTEQKEEGNVVSCAFVFIVTQKESSITLWPKAGDWSTAGIGIAGLNAAGAAKGDFLSSIKDTIKSGQAAVKGVVDTAQGYVRDVQNVVGDATRAVNVVQGIGAQFGIKMNFGRYGGGGILGTLNKINSGITSVNSGIAMVTRVNNATSSLLSSASRARASVDKAATTVSNLASKL